MATLSEIQSADWSLSVDAPGEVVQGANDIAQCLLIILTTVKGSDPLRPDFGCGLYDKLDQPVNTVAASMVLDITESIRRWEPRAALTGVKFSLVDQSNLRFSISWTDAYSQENNLIFTPQNN